MADKKIVATMATEFAVDSTKATSSIKELKAEITGLGREWKVQEAQLKSSGDAMGAAQAKVDGLTKQYNTNGQAINKIKADMSGLNREVADEREEYNKLAQQLLRAEQQQNSLNGQLNRAETALKGYKDGTIQLNREIKDKNTLTQATVERLQAEGRAEEANTVKIKALGETKERYSKLLSIEKANLAEIVEKMGTSSSEYTKQATYVERLGAKLAHTNNEFKELSHTDIKPNLSGLDLVRNRLEHLNDLTQKTNHNFRNIFLGNLVANGFTNALGSMHSRFEQLIDSSKEYNKEQQVMNATWTTLTDSAKKGKEMVDSVNQISTAFGQTAEITNELEQQFYHVFNQKKPTDELTKSMLTLADTLGMNDEQVKRLGLNFTHMLGSGRLQLGDFNMITDQLPMYGEKLLEFEQKAQHNTKLTMGELRKQMSAGKISAQDATAVINELGDKYKEASENMMGTASGMERVISARSKALTGALIAPIMNAKNPLFGVISKWASDKSTEKAFNGVGSAISKGFNTITSAFGKNFKGKDFTKTANDALNGLSKNITKFSDYIASHSKQITAFFKSVKEIGGDAFNTVKSTIQALMPVFKLIGGEAAKHPKLVGSMVVAWLSFAPALKATSKLISGVTGTLKAAQKVAGGFGFVFKKNEAGISRFGKVLSGLKKTVSGIGKVFSTTFKGIGKVVSVFGKSIGGLGKLIGKTLTTAGKAFLTFGKAIGLAFKANPIGLIVTAIVGLGTALIELYKHNAKFKKFVDGLVKAAKEFFSGAMEWFGKLFKGIGDGFTDIYKSVSKTVNTLVKDVTGFFKNLFKTVTDTFKIFGDLFSGNWGKLGTDIKKVVDDLIKTVKSFFKLGYDYLNGITGGWLGKMTGFFADLSKKIGKTIGDLWNGLKTAFQNGFDNLKQLMKIFQDIFTGNWKGLGKDVGKLVSSLWNGVKDTFGGAFKWLDKLTGGWLSRTNKGFADFGSGVTKIFSGMWDSIKKFATTGINDVIGIINGGIKGIDGVIHAFGGPKQAIGLIPKFAKGTNGAPKGLAMVNDQKGVSDAREAIIDNSGDVHILSGKNRLVNFSGGETVLPADATRQLFPHFANGTEGWLGKTVDFIGDKVSGAVDWVKDKFDDITAFLAHPLDSISKIMNHVIDGALGGASILVTSLTPAIGGAFSKSIVEQIKKLLGKLNEDGGPSVGNPGGAGVQRWEPFVKKALAALNLSTDESMVARVLRQINTESGGNPNVHQQVDDINMRTGNPAQGLMQVIPPTFNAYKLPGHDNILNGYDNILAGLNYAKHRYGAGLGALGNGHGYANGGLITQHQIAEIGEGNLPEMIIPLDKFKSSRAIQLLNGAVNAVAKNNGVQLDQSTNNHDDLSEKFDMMIGLLSQLVGQGQKPVTAVMDKNNFYNTQAKDGSLRAYQSFS